MTWYNLKVGMLWLAKIKNFLITTTGKYNIQAQYTTYIPMYQQCWNLGGKILMPFTIIPPRLPWWLNGKESACQCSRDRFDSWSRKIPHATGHGNYWACALEPRSRNNWTHMLQSLKPTCLEPAFCSKRSHHSKKPARCN